MQCRRRRSIRGRELKPLKNLKKEKIFFQKDDGQTKKFSPILESRAAKKIPQRKFNLQKKIFIFVLRQKCLHSPPPRKLKKLSKCSLSERCSSKKKKIFALRMAKRHRIASCSPRVANVYRCKYHFTISLMEL